MAKQKEGSGAIRHRRPIIQSLTENNGQVSVCRVSIVTNSTLQREAVTLLVQMHWYKSMKIRGTVTEFWCLEFKRVTSGFRDKPRQALRVFQHFSNHCNFQSFTCARKFLPTIKRATNGKLYTTRHFHSAGFLLKD